MFIHIRLQPPRLNLHCPTKKSLLCLEICASVLRQPTTSALIGPRARPLCACSIYIRLSVLLAGRAIPRTCPTFVTALQRQSTPSIKPLRPIILSLDRFISVSLALKVAETSSKPKSGTIRPVLHEPGTSAHCVPSSSKRYWSHLPAQLLLLPLPR